MDSLLLAMSIVLIAITAAISDGAVVERLLWPQRYYNKTDLFTLIQIALFTPLAGPLLLILESLTMMRQNGLFLGKTRAKFLGTAFYPSYSNIKYFNRSNGFHIGDDVGNGFWLTVLHAINEQTACQIRDLSKKALLTQRDGANPVRALQPVYTLGLRQVSNENLTHKAFFVTEHAVTLRTWIGLIASEILPIATCLYTIITSDDTSLGFRVATGLTFLLPLCIKLAMTLITVHREGLRIEGSFNTVPSRSNPAEKIFGIADPNLGFAVIMGPKRLVRHFSQHYGQPKSSDNICSEKNNVIGLIVAFLVYPMILAYFLYSTTTPAMQSLSRNWVIYQSYAVLAIITGKITGLSNVGRTERRIARALAPQDGGTLGRVILMGPGFLGVEVTLVIDVALGVAEGKAIVQKIVDQHNKLADDVLNARRAIFPDMLRLSATTTARTGGGSNVGTLAPPVTASSQLPNGHF